MDSGLSIFVDNLKYLAAIYHFQKFWVDYVGLPHVLFFTVHLVFRITLVLGLGLGLEGLGLGQGGLGLRLGLYNYRSIETVYRS